MRVALVLPYAPEANRGNSTAARRLARGLAAAGAAVEMASLEGLGIRLDPARNAALKGEGSLSVPGECVSILLIPADEERIVARAVAGVVSS